MNDQKRKPGRPREMPEGSTRTTIHLSPKHLAKAKRLGGTVAAGVRRALEEHEEYLLIERLEQDGDAR